MKEVMEREVLNYLMFNLKSDEGSWKGTTEKSQLSLCFEILDVLQMSRGASTLGIFKVASFPSKIHLSSFVVYCSFCLRSFTLFLSLWSNCYSTPPLVAGPMAANDSPGTGESPLALGNFPTEIAFSILDEIFMEGPVLTHTAMCSLRCLERVDQASANVVRSYLQRQNPSERLEQALNFEYFTYAEARGRLHLHGPDILLRLPGHPMIHPILRSAHEDIMTGAILDDCMDCFDWLCVQLPRLSRESVSPHGWSYVGLAMYSGCAHALNYFLRPVTDSADFVLTMMQFYPACAFRSGPAHFDLMTEKRILSRFEAVVDVLEPFFLAPASHLSCVNVRAESQFNVCSFVTPDLADRLQSNFAMPLNCLSIWNAAVRNGPAFMNYLLVSGMNIPRTLNRYHDEKTPLGATTRLNLIDSARWLVENYTRFDPTDQRCFEIDLNEEVKSAVTKSQPESLQFLEIFLSVTPQHHKIEDLPLSLISRLVYSLFLEVRRLQGLQYGERAFLRAHELEEQLAIQKCDVIFKAAHALGPPCMYHGYDESDPSARDQTAKLKSMTWGLIELGSERLTQVIESSCSCDPSSA